MKASLQYTSIWIVLLPLVVGLFNSQRLTKHSQLILLLTAVATPPQLISLLTHDESVKNMFYNIYTLLEFSILYYFFYTLLKVKSYKHLLVTSFFIYFFTLAIITTIHGIVKEVLDCAICINNLVYCFWILLFLYFDLNGNSSIFKLRTSSFCYIVTIFLYASVTCVYFAIKPYTDENNINIKLLHNLPNIQMYICFAIGFAIDVRNYRLKMNLPFYNEPDRGLNFSKA